MRTPIVDNTPTLLVIVRTPITENTRILFIVIIDNRKYILHLSYIQDYHLFITHRGLMKHVWINKNRGRQLQVWTCGLFGAKSSPEPTIACTLIRTIRITHRGNLKHVFRQFVWQCRRQNIDHLFTWFQAHSFSTEQINPVAVLNWWCDQHCNRETRWIDLIKSMIFKLIILNSNSQ